MASALWGRWASRVLIGLVFMAAAGCSDSGGGPKTPQAGTMGDGNSGGIGGVGGQAGSAGDDGGAPVGGMGGSGAGGSSGGMGGSSATGGSGTGGSDGGPMCTPHTGSPVLDPSVLDACGECGGEAHCVPSALLTGEQAAMLGDCQSGDKCVPDLLIASGGMFLLETCSSLEGAEGRCLSTCVPEVARQADRLPKDSCGDNELCVPCFDPITGEATGACSQSCDPGPAEEPFVFAGCCDDGEGGDLGACVPLALVPEDQRTLLGADTCTGTDLCAPKPIAAGTYQPTSCEGPGGAEARCLPSCLPDIAAQAERLVRGTCAQGELCAPCFDPITGADTGACTLEGDEPEDPPTTFPTCCDDGMGMDLGTCVPTALVPQDQQSVLGQDTCTVGSLCAPTPIAAGTYQPQACESWGGGEGRCLPSCLPDIAAQADQLTQASCDQGELCAPCFDPLSGESTGSCELEGDEPVEPPYEFPTCCDNGMGTDLGTCVPSALVSSEQASLLGQDSCGSGDLCAPTELANSAYTPESCDSWGGGEGRCLPSCLPDIAAQADQLTRGACAQGELCAPCFDPLTGESTGSCTIEGDMPADPAYTFPTCCSSGAAGNLGTCVPNALVSSEQSELLGQDTCGMGNSCAPTTIARGEYVPDVCMSWLGAEGRCLLACLPDVAAQASQLQDPASDDCDQGELCVPCFNPVSGDSTGACELEDDAPTNSTPETFPACCPTPSPNGTQRGTCVPTRAAGAQAASLPNLNCETLTSDADDYVCAPDEKVETPNRNFPTCTTAFSGPNNCGINILCGIARSTASGYINGKSGVCVPSCFLSEQSTEIVFYGTFATSDLYGQSTCAAGEDCAPCVYPEGHPDAGDPTGLCPP